MSKLLHLGKTLDAQILLIACQYTDNTRAHKHTNYELWACKHALYRYTYTTYTCKNRLYILYISIYICIYTHTQFKYPQLTKQSITNKISAP